MIHEFLLQMAGVAQTVSSIPRAVAKVRLAPLEAANMSVVIVIGGIDPTSLIPALDCSCHGVQDDGHIENTRVLPLVSDLLVQNASVIIVELVDLINVMRTLCNQGTFDEIVADIVEIMISSELLDIRDQLCL
jgi:hypothetical protein